MDTTAAAATAPMLVPSYDPKKWLYYYAYYYCYELIIHSYSIQGTVQLLLLQLK